MIQSNAAIVNGKPTADAQPGIGHNGGPDIYVREIGKLQAIDAVLKNQKVNQTQALILIGLIVRSNNSYRDAFPGGATLALYAKVKRTDTVFKALRELEDQFQFIKRESRGQGRSNSYSLLPQRIVDAVVEAYQKRKAEAGAVKATDAGTNPAQAGDPVSEPTRIERASSNHTHPPKAGEPQSEPTRLNGVPAQESHPSKAGATHPPKAGTDPFHIQSNKNRTIEKSFWKGAFGTESEDILLEDGKIILVNGVRISWLEQFDGDERRLDLALKHIITRIHPNGNKPIAAQVESQLARMVADRLDKDKRYEKARSDNAANQGKPAEVAKPPSRSEHFIKLVEAADAKLKTRAKGAST